MAEYYTVNEDRSLTIGDVTVPWSIARNWRTRPEAFEVESFLCGFRGEPLPAIKNEAPWRNRSRLCWHYRGAQVRHEIATRTRDAKVALEEYEAAAKEGAAAYRRGAPRTAAPREYSSRDRKAWQAGWDRERLSSLAAALPAAKEGGRDG